MNDFYKRKNPHRLYRDKDNAILAGVCAGIAEYAGLNRKGVRLVTILMMLFPPFFAFIVISYIILAIVIPVKPRDLFENQEQAEKADMGWVLYIVPMSESVFVDNKFCHDTKGTTGSQ